MRPHGSANFKILVLLEFGCSVQKHAIQTNGVNGVAKPPKLPLLVGARGPHLLIHSTFPARRLACSQETTHADHNNSPNTIDGRNSRNKRVLTTPSQIFPSALNFFSMAALDSD